MRSISSRCFLLSLLLYVNSNVLSALSLITRLQPIVTFTAGASMSNSAQPQSFTPLDLCHYSYKPKGSNTTTMLWGGFLGSEIKRSSSWEFTAGLSYYQPNDFSARGALTQGADSASDDTYRYNYQIKSQQVLAEGKVHWIANERIQPFVMMGIGTAFNTVFDYQTNVSPFLEFTPAFSNHTQTHFTYAIGPGVDINWSKSLRTGVAYRFTDLGSANTGSAQLDAIPIASTLNQSHLYANQMLFQFTYSPSPGLKE